MEQSKKVTSARSSLIAKASRIVLRSLLSACCSLVPVASAQTTAFPAKDSQIPGPACLNMISHQQGYAACTAADLLAWHKDVFNWRDETRIRIGFTDEQYRRPELKWTQSSFIQPQMMAEDRFFYDPVVGKYTVDRYLDDMEKRIGGIDSVLVWHSYPNIGVDDRSAFDLVRAMPGGIPALKAMVADFHKRGVRVLFPMMPWDQGTHTNGKPDWETASQLMAEIGADGLNGDTMVGIPRAFRDASDKTGHPLAFEPELTPTSNEMLLYDNMSWGYWKFPFAPLVSEAKLIEPRHMVHVSDRWNRSKTDDLQFAFFNGVGYEAWENVWGIWNGFTPRGAETIRRVATVERAVAPFLTSPDWEPLTPTLQFGIFASRWPVGKQSVFTVINRNEMNVDGPQIDLPYAAGMHYYDLWNGRELTPTQHGSLVSLSFPIEAQGFGAILSTPDPADGAMRSLMAKSKQWPAAPLKALSDAWKPLPQQMVPIKPTAVLKAEPKNMVKLPAADFLFRVDGLAIEGDDWAGLDVQYPWEDAARRHHLHQVAISALWIDRYPVTNAEYKTFVDATHYHPRDDFNFLKDWKAGTYPAGWENRPVTWVSQEDARAYAAWAGKRLPHEWEWQYAAQGTDGRVYPWGNGWNDAAVPTPDTTRDLTAPDKVDAHPAGASPSGVMDLVGNVWQWTDEYQDEHTRAAVLRGGSYFQPQGSRWYFPKAYRNTEHGKLLLMAPSKDRAGTIGFRCVVDAAQ